MGQRPQFSVLSLVFGGMVVGTLYGWLAYRPPSDKAALAALDQLELRSTSNSPMLYELSREEVRLEKRLIGRTLNPLEPRRFECTILCKEIIRVDWPIPHMLEDEEVQYQIFLDVDWLGDVVDVGWVDDVSR